MRVIARINADAVGMLDEPAVKARYAPLGIEAAGKTGNIKGE